MIKIFSNLFNKTKITKKYFSFSMLNYYYNKYNGKLKTLSIGMKNDWDNVHEDYIEYGITTKTIPVHIKDQNVQGVYGSSWDIPIIKIEFWNGECEEIRCIAGIDWSY